MSYILLIAHSLVEYQYLHHDTGNIMNDGKYLPQGTSVKYCQLLSSIYGMTYVLSLLRTIEP